jgi:hypothetical protein
MEGRAARRHSEGWHSIRAGLFVGTACSFRRLASAFSVRSCWSFSAITKGTAAAASPAFAFSVAAHQISSSSLCRVGLIEDESVVPADACTGDAVAAAAAAVVKSGVSELLCIR